MSCVKYAGLEGVNLLSEASSLQSLALCHCPASPLQETLGVRGSLCSEAAVRTEGPVLFCSYDSEVFLGDTGRLRSGQLH